VRPVEGLIRFVAAPDGSIVPDLKRRLPGRGVWVTASRPRVAEAARRGAFQRSLKADVKVPGDLADRVGSALEQSALDALSIARKAGLVITGFTKVEAAAAQGSAIALIHATDAAGDGVRKITGAARRPGPGSPAEIPQIRAFSSAQLDLALGRTNVVHAALLAGRASDGFLARWRTLDDYRTGEPGQPGDRYEGVNQPNQQAETGSARLGTE
jgi:predicted RNA-binding protein YlxR (DUF448 family)